MAECVHEYDRTVVIRLHYWVMDDGRVDVKLRVDSDITTRHELIGVLTRASWIVGNCGDVQHEQLQVSGLPPWDPEEDEEDG